MSIQNPQVLQLLICVVQRCYYQLLKLWFILIVCCCLPQSIHRLCIFLYWSFKDSSDCTLNEIKEVRKESHWPKLIQPVVWMQITRLDLIICGLSISFLNELLSKFQVHDAGLIDVVRHNQGYHRPITCQLGTFMSSPSTDLVMQFAFHQTSCTNKRDFPFAIVDNYSMQSLNL